MTIKKLNKKCMVFLLSACSLALLSGCSQEAEKEQTSNVNEIKILTNNDQDKTIAELEERLGSFADNILQEENLKALGLQKLMSSVSGPNIFNEKCVTYTPDDQYPFPDRIDPKYRPQSIVIGVKITDKGQIRKFVIDKPSTPCTNTSTDIYCKIDDINQDGTINNIKRRTDINALVYTRVNDLIDSEATQTGSNLPVSDIATTPASLNHFVSAYANITFILLNDNIRFAPHIYDMGNLSAFKNPFRETTPHTVNGEIRAATLTYFRDRRFTGYDHCKYNINLHLISSHSQTDASGTTVLVETPFIIDPVIQNDGSPPEP